VDEDRYPHLHFDIPLLRGLVAVFERRLDGRLLHCRRDIRAQHERNLILATLERNDWNRLRTADEIGIPRTTLLAKMKRFNIAPRENV
jgi:transcriptional regulator of acetoin/glycerol metabolism